MSKLIVFVDAFDDEGRPVQPVPKIVLCVNGSIDSGRTCDTDITECVQIMYDALIHSVDWGSGFLTEEETAALGFVGCLMGIEQPNSLILELKNEDLPRTFEDWKQFIIQDRMASIEAWERKQAEIAAERRAELEAKFPGMLPWSTNG